MEAAQALSVPAEGEDDSPGDSPEELLAATLALAEALAAVAEAAEALS